MTSTVARQSDSRGADSDYSSLGWLPALTAIALACYLTPRALVGADTMWMVALGDHIASGGSALDGVPFAAADTSGWPNVPVLGELLLHAVHSLAPVGLTAALLGIGTGTLLLLARDAVRSGAHPAAAAGALGLAGLGMLPTFGVVRAQMLSLLPYALLVLLLRAETRSPSRRIWLVVPMIAIWGNLHGGVLVGVALTGCYLGLARLRTDPLTAVLVGVATLASVWANPALLRTGHYYLGVLSNEAARRGTELWARPDLGSTFDLLMVVAALGLGIAALLRGRLSAWEVGAALGMAVATAMSARHGMWLLLFLLGPAATGMTRMIRPHCIPPAPAPEPQRRPGMPGVSPRPAAQLLLRGSTIGLALVAALTLLGREADLRGPVEAVQMVKSLAANKVVLAPEPLAEDLAAAGVTVWASNPIDAFRPEDQAAYLDVWLGHPGGRRAIGGSSIVVAAPGSPAFRMATSAGCSQVGQAADLAVLDCER